MTKWHPFYVIRLAIQKFKWIIIWLLAIVVVASFLGTVGVKYYQDWDNDPERGAVSVTGGAFGEDYAVPEYLDQGWDEADSLWFYNTTQGSALLPYDFLLVLEQPVLKKVECERNGEKAAWFLCDNNVDRFRYLPQKSTFFNPDALPVGFVKEPYQGKDYVGFTCAACHTGQVNFEGRALRVDGGPAMADIVTFLKELKKALKEAQSNSKGERFVRNVLKLDNDYDSKDEVEKDLKKWTDVIDLYNSVNNSTFDGRKIEYGHARLDAFGRIYNRVLQYVINKDQFADILARLMSATGRNLLTEKQVENVLEGVDDTVIGDVDFALILERLRKSKPDYPGLSRTDLLRVRNKIFNRPNAPVSYPFLWDTAQSDYVQWNGLASNASVGPLGRNAGEVIGVFGILDWREDDRLLTRLTGFSLSAWISGQDNKRKKIRFDSSVDLFNLQRLESHLRSLKSPIWPFCRDDKTDAYYLPMAKKGARPPEDPRPCRSGDKKFDEAKLASGQSIYEDRCQGCHEVIDRDDWDRKVIAKMSSLRKVGTDRSMATNSVTYKGKAGNFKYTYQGVDVGKVLVEEKAPVVELLTAATRGVIATPDPDKWWPRRIVEWVYVLVMSIADNDIKASIKSGNYDPDTTAKPFDSLLSYKARSLNGIWATAPFLHNGSVPTLYDLLLPVKCKEGAGDGKYRPDSFVVGAREFDPVKVGFKSEGYDGFKFNTALRGNRNTGHEYGACGMSDADRWDLIEYLKSL